MNDFFDLLNSSMAMLRRNDVPDYCYTPLKKEYVDDIKNMAKSFEEGSRLGGLYYFAEFDNGYGIDIIKHNGSYGREDDLFEIAVMKDGECCYSTPITDDVVGWLSDDEVMDYVAQVQALPVS